ncbi:MAG: xylan 1,4-beta-xylosidase [Lachnospiraceae bacterium]|nr:xylan 1,4-beta-xylosidase [Lachnospiraceae bacterium]MBQ6544959.1 xylan 1,4-beta-xylosidase [Lachnospiraceae bacterium]
MFREIDRFKKVYQQGGLTGARVLEDQETGIQYLFVWDGYAGGLTVLLDANGQPMRSGNGPAGYLEG